MQRFVPANWDVMFRTLVHVCVFLVGLLGVCWVGIGYLGSNPLGACVAAVIGACYVAGALELYRYRQATATLEAAVDGLTTAPSALSDWLQAVHPGLHHAVRLRIKGERVALPAPVLTPYLVGLLVLLGMLGTLLGMMATLKGTGVALQSATDLQAIRGSLAAPVEGLAFAFGTSIAGVATSAMLGLLSALCRRERLQAVQRLDLKIASELHPHSNAYQRGEAFKLQQQQSALMPALIDRLQALMHNIEQHSIAADERVAAQQADFHAKSEAAYARLATSMEQSLQAGVAESARAVGVALQPAMDATMASIARDTAALQAHVTQAVQQQLDGITQGVQTSASTAAAHWKTALAAQERAQQTHNAQLQITLEQIAGHSVALQESVSSAVQQQLHGVSAAIEQSARTAAEHWQVALAAQERTQHTLTEQLQGTLEHIDQRSVAVQDSVTQAVQQQLSALNDGFARSTAATADTLAAVLAEQQRATAALSTQLQATLEQLGQQTSALHEGVQQAVQQQLDGLRSGFATSTATAAATWTAAVAEQQRTNHALTQALQGTLTQFASTFEARSAALVDAVSQRMEQSRSDTASAWSDALAQQQQASATLSSQHHSALAAATASFDAHAAALVGTLQQLHTDLQAALEARDTERLALWSERLGAMSTALTTQWEQTGERVARQQQAICDTLASTASALSTQAQAQASATITEVSRLMQIASEAPKLRPTSSPSCANTCPKAWCATPPCWKNAASCLRPWTPCSTRSITPPPNNAKRWMPWSPPRPTCCSVWAASSPNRSVARPASSAKLLRMSAAARWKWPAWAKLRHGGAALQWRHQRAQRTPAAPRHCAGCVAGTQRRPACLLRGAGARSGRPQHAVAEADHRRTAPARSRPWRYGRSRNCMSEEIENDGELGTPIWAAFGDLMSVLLGAFVLILVGVIGVQLQLSSRLDEAVKQRQAEAQRRQTLEQALAAPLAAGRVTLVDGRIGIRGNVLFAFNSDELQPEGREVLKSLAAPLAQYLRAREEILMVSGFTDDRPVLGGNRRYADNWELSAQRALTVTRALIAEGVPASSVFAAAFGSQQPVDSNADEARRAKNRRVEIAPIARPSSSRAAASKQPATAAAPR